VVDEQTDSSRGANDDVIATDVMRGWQNILRMININDQRIMRSGERPAQMLN